MAKGKFLQDLLGELSLDRALLQILDEPYVKDLATRLKQNEAVSEIMGKLDKDEGVYGWMDYDQLLKLREIILPEMLMKHSELEAPTPELGGEIGKTFDDQFESIFGKKKFAKGGSFMKNILGTLIDEFSERMGIEGPVFDKDPQAYTRDIANWMRLAIGDEFFFHPKIKDSIKGTLMHIDQVDAGMEAGKHYYPDIMETAMEKYPQFSGVGDDLSGLGIPQEDLRNALGSAYSTVHTFKEILSAMEKAKNYRSVFPEDDLPKNARGGIMALQDGGEYGESFDYIESPTHMKLWDEMSRDEQEMYRLAMKKKYAERGYKGSDIIPYPKKAYWNEELRKYQNMPITEEQFRSEPWIHKQRREPHKEIKTQTWGSGDTMLDMARWLGMDPAELNKIVGDEPAYQKSYWKSVIPGMTTMPFYSHIGELFGLWGDTAEEFHRNQEDFSARTGIFPSWKQSMGLGMGVGLPLGYAIDRGILSLAGKLNPKLAPLLKEVFPLSLGKGPFSKEAWKKSLWRNPKHFLKMHVPGKTGQKAWSQILNPAVKALLPKVAQRYGIAAVPYVGWIAALGLGAYDTYRMVNWFLSDPEGDKQKEMQKYIDAGYE